MLRQLANRTFSPHSPAQCEQVRDRNVSLLRNIKANH